MKSYNAALSYAKRTNPQGAAFMPDTVSYRGLRSEIQTARELNNVVRRLRRGGKAKAFALVQNEAGTVTTRWQQREAQIAFNTRERRKAMERRRLGIQNAAGILTGNIGTIQERGLRPSQLKPSKMNRVQMERIVELEREQTRKNAYDRAMDYYLNYTTALGEIGANNVGDGSTYWAILESMSNIMEKDPNALIDMFWSGDDALEIGFVYDENVVIETRLRYVLEVMQKVERERGLS